MKIVVMRLGLAIKSKETAYNVQEIGLAKALNKMGHTIQVVYFLKDIQKEEKSANNEFVSYLPARAIGHQVVISEKEVNGLSCDALILFCDNKVSSHVVINWCKKNKKPYVCYFGIYKPGNNGVVQRLMHQILTYPNKSALRDSCNATKTRSVKRVLEEEGIPVQRVIPVGLDQSLLHNCVSENEKQAFRKENNIGDDAHIVLFVGRLTEDKKPLFALSVLKELLRYDNYHMIMIGTGELKSKVDQYIAENSMKNVVSRIDKVPYSEIYKYYTVSEYFLNCRDDEIFGMAILEGMYYGCKVVAHQAPGPDDIIENSVTGILMDNYDAVCWAKKIQDIRSDDELVKNARQTVQTRFTWDYVAGQFVDCIYRGNRT